MLCPWAGGERPPAGLVRLRAWGGERRVCPPSPSPAHPRHTPGGRERESEISLRKSTMREGEREEKSIEGRARALILQFTQI